MNASRQESSFAAFLCRMFGHREYVASQVGGQREIRCERSCGWPGAVEHGRGWMMR